MSIQYKTIARTEEFLLLSVVTTLVSDVYF